MIKFSYLRDPKNPKLVLTIAREIVKEGQLVGTIQQFSLCSPKDQFSKKIGRKIACGRLEKHPLGYYSNITGYLKKGDSAAAFAMRQIQQFCKECSEDNYGANHYGKILKIIDHHLKQEKPTKK